MHKIGFVILNYNTPEETKNCVKSIEERLDTQDFHIVIVDNYSSDNSGAQLQKEFAKNQAITVLPNNENMGFAKGNNVGFAFAKHDLNCDFIVMLNSDTYLLQDDFATIIFEEYNKSKFAILGPRVISPKHLYSDNPGRNTVMSMRELDNYVWKVRIHLYLNHLQIEKPANDLLALLKKWKGKQGLSTETAGDESWKKIRHENVLLHGCCLVFSPAYIERFDGLDSRTFLYLEEDILFTKMMKEQLLTVYNPKLKIFHTEDVSTDLIWKRPILKRRNNYVFILQSAKVLRAVLTEYHSNKKEIEQ